MYGAFKVNGYNRTGQLIQSIQHDNTGLDLYCMPNYITENNNRDAVVSDSNLAGAVVVTDYKDYKGRHRFTYAKHPPKFFPLEICTDAMSHILLCDGVTRSINILNKDGQFLSHLEIELSVFEIPTNMVMILTGIVFGLDLETIIHVRCSLTDIFINRTH